MTLVIASKKVGNFMLSLFQALIASDVNFYEMQINIQRKKSHYGGIGIAENVENLMKSSGGGSFTLISIS